MASPTLRFKRGTQSAFAAVGLQTGEPAFITDESNFYIGVDGQTSTNKFFGSSRYWKKETTSVGGGVNLFGSHSVGVSGTSITLAAPDSVGTAVTYTFPATPVTGGFLKTNSTGTLSWDTSIGGAALSNSNLTGITTIGANQSDSLDINANTDISGITTFSNTADSTTKDNGAVVIEGGVGIEKSLNVGGNLKVTGVSTFVGNVTFEGGTINLGDSNTDNVVFTADVNSNILPNTDATFDIGDASASKRWRHASFSGVGTFATGAVADAVQIGITLANEIDTSSGVLILDSAAGQVQIQDDLSVTGVSTFTGAVNVNNTVRVGAGLSVAGISTFTSATTFNNGITVNNAEATFSSATVSDLTAGRVVLAGASGALVDDSSLTFSDAAGLTVANSGINVTGVSTFSTDVRVSGDLTVAGNDIRDSGGTAAITFDGSGNTTITGNLNVNGSTTQVNTSSLTVEDRTIELGIVNGSAPSSATTWDLGILFNYHATSAKKSAVVWEHGDGRFKFASEITDGGGTDNNSPQITFTTFAPIEISELWVNNACTGGADAVIACSGGELQLQNIVVDAGTF